MNTTFNKGDMAEFAKYSVEHFKATSCEKITNASVDYWMEWKEVLHKYKDYVLEIRNGIHQPSVTFTGMDGRTAFDALISAFRTGSGFHYKQFIIEDVSNWEMRYGEIGHELMSWTRIDEWVEYSDQLFGKK